MPSVRRDGIKLSAIARAPATARPCARYSDVACRGQAKGMGHEERTDGAMERGAPRDGLARPSAKSQ